MSLDLGLRVRAKARFSSNKYIGSGGGKGVECSPMDAEVTDLSPGMD